MIKYKTWLGNIYKVKVIKQTDKSVFFKSSKSYTGFYCERKFSNGIGYFDTWEEAYDHLVNEEQAFVDKLQRKINYRLKILEKVKTITKGDLIDAIG